MRRSDRRVAHHVVSSCSVAVGLLSYAENVAVPRQTSPLAEYLARATIWSAPAPLLMTRRTSNDPLGAWVVRWPLQRGCRPASASRSTSYRSGSGRPRTRPRCRPSSGLSLSFQSAAARARALRMMSPSLATSLRAAQASMASAAPSIDAARTRARPRSSRCEPPCLAAAALRRLDVGHGARCAAPAGTGGGREIVGPWSDGASDLRRFSRGATAPTMGRCPLDAAAPPSTEPAARRCPSARTPPRCCCGPLAPHLRRDRRWRSGSSSRTWPSCSWPGSPSASGSATSSSAASSTGRPPRPALYVESIIEPGVASLADGAELTPAGIADARRAPRDAARSPTASGRCASGPRTAESSTARTRASSAARFPVERPPRRGAGRPDRGRMDDLSGEENAWERARWSRLLELYVPVRERGSERIIARRRVLPAAARDRPSRSTRRGARPGSS